MPDATEDGFSTNEFATLFKRFLDDVVSQADVPEPFFLARLRDHLGEDPAALPVVAQHLQAHDLPNLQLAIDSVLALEGRSSELMGLAQAMRGSTPVGLSDLVLASRSGFAPMPGPVAHQNVTIDGEEVLSCVAHGLYLVEDRGHRLALLIRGGDNPFQPSLVVEAMAPEQQWAEALLAELRTAMRDRNIYRNRVLSLTQQPHGGIKVHFHRLPRIARDQIVLPEGTLERIERHTMGFARQSARLLAAGRHLKRGILLHGPPGTGKTHTAMYLAGQMEGRTVLMLTGQALALIAPSCKLARELQPATVILEDVDLVAEQRTHQDAGRNAVLFELLNQMDGLADDADIVFLLTTNRADLLEPALAARPGRVDQAVAVPLPDASCRARLLDLYGRGLTLRLEEKDRLVERTKGVSAAFIKELLRKAALFSAEATDLSANGDGIVVDDNQVEQALLEMMIEGGELTKSLFGGTVPNTQG